MIGSGVMGTNHLRVAQRTPGIELVAVVENDADRLASVQVPSTVKRLDSVEALLAFGEFDSAVVATPTALHYPTAVALIDRKKHVLVEKPLALNTDEASDLVARAESAGVVLTVGHVERFNPVVGELLRNLANPLHVSILRVGPFSPRVLDNVVNDLMVHDLDLAWAIGQSELVNVATVVQSSRTAGPDLAVSLLRFESGLTATLTSSRIGQQKTRSIEVTQADSVIVADLLKQEIQIHRQQQVEFVSDLGTRVRHTGTIEVPMIEKGGEPLMLELASFAETVAGKEPYVTGHDGVRAIRWAAEVLKSTLGS